MAWWAEKGPANGQAVLRKSDKSPGPNWVQIPGATDSMTEQQAAQQLANDAASGVFGSSIKNGIDHLGSKLPGAGQVQSVEQFLGDLSNSNTWIRVAKVVVGGAMILVGLSMLASRTSTVQSAVATAAKVAK